MTASEPIGQHRIVTGTDGSESSIEALHWAARQAQLTGATLTVVTTWDWPSNWGWAVPLPEGYDPEADARALLDTVVEPIRKEYSEVVLETRAVEGHPAPALVSVSQAADLLVVGSRGHGQFTGMLLGSVSEYCVRNAHCPVTVVRGRKEADRPSG